MKIKTSELTGPALDWAVGFARTLQAVDGRIILARDLMQKAIENGLCPYSTDWAHGGPIIEREKISVIFHQDKWRATNGDGVTEEAYSFSPTEQKPGGYYGAAPGFGDEFADNPLVAAMRCYVASKLGDEVDIPEELI